MASSGHALIRKHFRKRFGVSARQVAVRPETPWYFRALLWTLILGSSLALSAWMYDAGRRFAGFDQGTLTAELDALRQQAAADSAELTTLRSAVGTAEGQLQVERATLERLSSQLGTLQRENAALKEELAFFEGLASGARSSGGGPAITRATLSVDGGGHARYRVLLSNAATGRKLESLQGELQFDLKVVRAGRDATILIPQRAGERAAPFPVTVKHFARLEGEFNIQKGDAPLSGEVRLLRGAQVLARHAIALEP